jgi:sugar-specific transcriptional regulator TrmB
MKPEYRKQIQKFLALGLTEREAKVYITLLSKRAFTTLELQNSVDIPRTKIYEVLQKMLSRGICTERAIGKIKYYEAVEPKQAFQKVLDDYRTGCESEFEKKKSSLDGIVNIFNPIFENNKDFTYPLDFVEIFKDKEHIQAKYIQAVKESKTDLLTFNKGPYVCDTAGRLKEQEMEEHRLIKRGVECRNIFVQKEIDDFDWLRKYVKGQAKLGQQARVIDSLPIKMMVFDESRVFFPLIQNGNANQNLTMIFIEHKELAIACKMLFNMLWEMAKPV